MPEPIRSLEETAVQSLLACASVMERGHRLHQEKAAAAVAIADGAAKAAQALVDNGRIDAEHRQDCIDACLDHKKALQLLKYAAEHRLASEQLRDIPATEVDRNGRAVKTASFRVIGERRMADEPDPKDAQFDRDIGLA